MKLWSCMFVGAGILASTLAWFQQPDGPGGPPRRGDERGDVQREGRPPKNPIMEALDPDHDHVISAEEIKAATSALKKLDANDDGKLTEDEIRPEHAGSPEGRPPREGGGRPPRGEQRQPDDNAGGPEGEFGPLPGDRPGPPRGPQGGPQGGPPSPERMVDHAFEFDANKDGLLSREELLEFAEQMPMHGPGGPGGPEGGPQGRPEGNPQGGPQGRPEGRGDQNRPTRPARPSSDK